jgi:hypothetical protein
MISALNSAMGTGTSNYITFGQSSSANNQAELCFTYVGSGNGSNTLDLGMYGKKAMTIFGYGNISFNTTSAPSGILFRAYGTTGTDFNFGPQTGAGNNAFVVYNQSNQGVYLTNGNTAFQGTSDIRVKKNMSPMNKGLDYINKLKPSYYNYLNDADTYKIRIGFIAQEVEEVIPEIVSIRKEGDYDDLRGLALGDFTPYLVNAVKDLSKLNENLNLKVETQNTQLNDLNLKFESQNTQLNDLNLKFESQNTQLNDLKVKFDTLQEQIANLIVSGIV